jgi:hypothetical protein
LVWDGDGNGDIGKGSGFASGVIQDITWYGIDPGDGHNGIVVQYVADVPVGQEYFEYNGTAVIFHISSSGMRASDMANSFTWFMAKQDQSVLSTMPVIGVHTFAGRNTMQMAPATVTLSGGSQTAMQRPNNIYVKNSLNVGNVSLNTGTSQNIGTFQKFTVSYSDLAAAVSNGPGFVIATLPANTVVLASYIKCTTAFNGGAIADYIVSVGWTDAGGDDAAFGTLDVFNTGASPYGQLNLLRDPANPTHVAVFAQSYGAFLNAATQGSVDIYLYTAVLA